ncbi:hypothetical protein ADK77_08335 [Streptomyces antibioticus]|nr:hypothetical protein [Streptomyces antibioticus]KOG73529.1 hypothetical protein ADK77_08335 [Streptomyces antibioticus]
MTTVATVRDTGQLDDTTAADIATLWNAASPTMRTILTASINGLRDRIQREGWKQADMPKSDWGSSRDLGARLARLEGLRRSLGQLDRGTYRGCTRSPGGFSVLHAYWSVRDVLAATSINDRGLAGVYELAAILSRASDSWHRDMAARHSA